ncbi:MAG: membrane protein insertase YidC [Halieaceae bacterium]
MDLIRSLLIGVIAVLSFMLLTEWVNFKQQHTAPPARTAAQALPETTNADSPDLPSVAIVEVTDESNADDIPVISAAPEAVIAAPAASRSNAVVSASSDTMTLRIDLSGGDIVEVALPGYPARLNTPDVPFLLLEDNDRRVYVAQSGLIGRDGIDADGRARFTSTQSSYSLADDEDTLVINLTPAKPSGVDIIKRYTLHRGEYLIDVEYLVNNQTGERWQANLFGQIKRDGSQDPSAEQSSGMGMVPFLGTATTLPDERFVKFDFEDMREKPFKQKVSGGWIAMIQHYFLSAWIPDEALSHSYSTRVTNNGFNIGGFVSPALVVDPGQQGSISARFYAGPKDQYRLAEISEYLDLSVDYGWLWWIAQPLFWLLIQIFDLVGNWGVAIILLTVCIKAAFFKLSATSYRSMANMRRVQPQMASIKERYGEDKQKQSQAMMDLYKKEKINPLAGCLPILVQMPVFIALYWVLMESVELRQAPFFAWITDLSVMDPYFILPLIMGASMFFQQKLSPPMADPMQAKVMQWMPVIFTFFFLWFPAGLVLYWVTNNLLSIAQQWYITRQIEQAGAKS